MELEISTLQKTAQNWRDSNQCNQGGIVLVWQGTVYGWKNELRDPQHEQPGAIAVDPTGQVFIAEGGDAYNGATHWSPV
ncbi:antirestriction protein ArdR [Pseudomonas sp. BN605]|uniref:antirestriction protein ArdR n=1 Tax=Pseudomonas TaxID=286 RepID=UPI0024558DAC|nr:antirestriction protein ArdR [Pseudomonas sp. BN605]MDH4845074.1 antirestriction protein ArdR [Pseudomonas sp. BN605]